MTGECVGLHHEFVFDLNDHFKVEEGFDFTEVAFTKYMLVSGCGLRQTRNHVYRVDNFKKNLGYTCNRRTKKKTKSYAASSSDLPVPSRTKRIEECDATIGFIFDSIYGTVKVGKTNAKHCHLPNAVTGVLCPSKNAKETLDSRYDESLLPPSCLNNMLYIEDRFELTSKQIASLTNKSSSQGDSTLDIQTILRNLDIDENAAYVAIYSVPGEANPKIQIKFPSINAEPCKRFDLPAIPAFEPYD
eukprot:Awhi_evm1s14579